MNHSLAEYHVPVNADIGDIDVVFVDERDEIVNALGSKGVGEIGIVGVAAAVANAIYHATGRSEEHTSELQSLMRISFAVFCLKTKNIFNDYTITYHKSLPII